MASITNRPLNGAGKITTFFADLMGRLAAWNDVQATKRALRQLSDRDLDDLGLVRADIDAVAENRYRR